MERSRSDTAACTAKGAFRVTELRLAPHLQMRSAEMLARR
jgi:hypothetical protein